MEEAILHVRIGSRLDRREYGPYFEEQSTETVMWQQRTLVAILALGALFVSPFAWGCEGTSMKNCRMSDCPMTHESEADDCHDLAAPPEHDTSGCDAEPEVWIACCDAPIDQEPARVESAASLDRGATPLTVLAERVEIQPPWKPPDLISEAVCARQHELGTFTLLSSFLL